MDLKANHAALDDIFSEFGVNRNYSGSPSYFSFVVDQYSQPYLKLRSDLTVLESSGKENQTTENLREILAAVSDITVRIVGNDVFVEPNQIKYPNSGIYKQRNLQAGS